jgi:signal transduction histidine kinase
MPALSAIELNQLVDKLTRQIPEDP